MSNPYQFTQSRKRFSANQKAQACESILNGRDPDLAWTMLEQSGYSREEITEWLSKYSAGGYEALIMRPGRAA